MFDAKKLLDMMVGSGGAQGAQGGASQGGIGGLIGSVLGRSGSGGGAGGALGGLASMAGQILGQATQGVKEGAQKIDGATGASTKADQMLRGATGGQGAGDLLARAKDMAGKNPLAAGAAIGGIGALLLGTRMGRGLAGSAAQAGALALIGGLAYKAYQNYSAGKPLLGGAAAGQIEEAPTESPYGTTGDSAADNETAMLMIRSMIAAAAADGMIDNEERSRIIGGLEQAGLDVNSAKFLDQEFAHPARVSDLVAAATTPEMKAQVYTAARIAIDPDTAEEKSFLAALSAQLGLDAGFVDHIEAVASGAKQA
jgi:uncharacterized membrane protein YebE (DUF533 family)